MIFMPDLVLIILITIYFVLNFFYDWKFYFIIFYVPTFL
jgi:hypothetical protein